MLFGSRLWVSRKCSSCLCAFSIMTIAESTIAPMAMAMPPNDMMFEVTCIHHIGMNVSDILQVNWRPVFHFEDDVFDVLNLFDVAAAANVILGRCDFENFPAYVGIAHFDGADDVAERDVVSNERVWIEIDLILFYESAHRRDLGDAFHGGKRIAQVPILNGAQLSEIVFSGVIDQRVFVNPADTGSVGTNGRIHALRQGTAH